MIEVTIQDITPNDIIEIVRELRKKGYTPGVEFDFTYNPPRFDNFSGDAVYNRCVVFTFYKEELATWFTLTYH